MEFFVAAIIFLVEVGIPVAGAVYFLQRRDGTFLTFLVGAAGFFVSQPLLRLPLLDFLGQKSTWISLLPYTSIVGYFALMGLTAGLFEETARWLGFKFFRKGRVSWMDGLAYGLGHGGCEAAWLFFSAVLPAIRQGQTQPTMVIGAWERIFTIMIQIGLSFVVLYSLKTGKVRYLFLAVLLHTIVDFLIILGNVWILEGLIAAEGILALVLVLRQRKNWDAPEDFRKNKTIH